MAVTWPATLRPLARTPNKLITAATLPSAISTANNGPIGWLQ